MYASFINDEVHDWTQFTLVMPTVSVGNVGQLACDVIISTLRARRIGYLYHDSILPVVGPDPFLPASHTATSSMATALDVYESIENKTVIVQQRASLIKSRIRKFVDQLVEWINCCNFKQLLILTSVFAHERRDSQLVGPQTRFLISPSVQSKIGNYLVTQLGWTPLEKRTSDNSCDTSDIFIPGSGIAKRLYLKCISAGIDVLVLLIFCAEGDNTLDALSLASYTNFYTNWIPQKDAADVSRLWIIPPSWQLLFGYNADQTLFQ